MLMTCGRESQIQDTKYSDTLAAHETVDQETRRVQEPKIGTLLLYCP
jgi:hypothetical protein